MFNLEELGFLAMQFRRTDNELERKAIAASYAEVMKSLAGCGEVPAPEDCLPDAWMPLNWVDKLFAKQDKPKVVIKPWGKECWLELNDKYCYKRIYINAGHRTSLQYHNVKQETNYIISGEAKVYLGDTWYSMKTDDFFTVKPPTLHRIEAITDIILQEVSTPEVDDVVRVEDDAGRPNGRIEKEHE